MPDISDFLPIGYSVSVPKGPPPGSKKMTAAEIEQDMLTNISKHQKELRNAIFNLAIFYSQIGRLDSASTNIEYLMQITSDAGEKAHYYFSLGQIMEQYDNFPMAVEYYQKAFALEPANKDDWYFIHNNLGYSLNKLGRYPEGERFCRTAIKINPKRHNAYKNLAIAFEGQGQYADAAEYYIKATKANASDSRALRHLEDLLRKHPQLLRENTKLHSDLEDCQKASKFAQEFVQGIIEKYWK